MILLARLLTLLILYTSATAVQAMRSDVLVIVNDNSVDSLQVGSWYAGQRGIDPANIVHVRTPDSYFIDWDEFRRLRDQLIRFMQLNTLDDPSMAPAVCNDGDPPVYCPAAVEQLRKHSRIRYLVTTRGVPTRVRVAGSSLYEPTSPSSVDNYLKYWLLNYFATDTALAFEQREVAFGDGHGMRTVQPLTDRELIVGRIDGLTLDSAKALVNRALSAERNGLVGRLYGSTQFWRWENAASSALVYPDWRYQLGIFDEPRAECSDYLEQPGTLPEGKSPLHCRVQLNEDSKVANSRRYPAPGNGGARQPQVTDALVYQGWLDGQSAVGRFDALLNWRKQAGDCTALCADSADPLSCQTASDDVFGELNSACVGVMPGFIGYNHQSYPLSYLAAWPTGWTPSGSREIWHEGGQGEGDIDQLAFPEVRHDTGFDDSDSLWFRNTDEVADPRCYATSDFSGAPTVPCPDRRRVILAQRIPLAVETLDTNNPPVYRFSLRYRAENVTLPTDLGVSIYVHEVDGGSRQVDYGFRRLAHIEMGDTGWEQVKLKFGLDPALHSSLQYDGLKVVLETSGSFSGGLAVDTISLTRQGAGGGAELIRNGSFDQGHHQVATGDHAAMFLDRMGGTAFWGSVSHHQSGGCAFCFNGLETLVYFLRGLPLGDAVWFNESNNSGLLYGDPLYSPVAVRLQPVNATDTLSGVVQLMGSTVNGRDPARVSTLFRVDLCEGRDFYLCDRTPGAWQPTGISGAGGFEDGELGSLDTTGLPPGDYTLRLSVTSTQADTGRSQTFNDFYTATVAKDQDGDGIPDDRDNCQLVANPQQTDTNGDGYGNLCDADVNNDNITNTLDIGLIRGVYGNTAPYQSQLEQDMDFNSDGIINTFDIGILRDYYLLPPGPSCCGQ